MSGPPAPVRVPHNPDEARAHFEAVTDLLEATIGRAGSFSEDERARRVNDEWSLIESFQHMVFAIDLWLGTVIKGETDPFHRIGLPPHFVERTFNSPSIDPSAAPSFAEAATVLRERFAQLGAYVDSLTPDELARPVGTHAETVAGALGVIFDELTYHDGFINRDLTALEDAR